MNPTINNNDQYSIQCRWNHKMTTKRVAFCLGKAVRKVFYGSGQDNRTAAVRIMTKACVTEPGVLDALMHLLTDSNMDQVLKEDWVYPVSQMVVDADSHRALRYIMQVNNKKITDSDIINFLLWASTTFIGRELMKRAI